jgi:hypothetical protein
MKTLLRNGLQFIRRGIIVDNGRRTDLPKQEDDPLPEEDLISGPAFQHARSILLHKVTFQALAFER